MKILWVNPSFLDYRIPLYEELNKLCNGDFHLVYSINRIPERCNKKIQQVLKRNAHGLSKEKRFNFGKESDFSNSHISIPYPSGLYKAIKSVKPDFIIAEGFFQFTPWALWYSLVHRIPLMIAYERTAHTERNCPSWRRLYRKFVNCFVNGYIANGILTKEYLISQGVKAKNIFTGGMCADSIGLAKQVENMSEAELAHCKESVFGNTTDGLRFIAVGQMIPRKGISQLIAGFTEHLKHYPGDSLLLVGDGPDIEKYKGQAASIPAIKFTGSIDYTQIYKYYAISDVFVIATLEDNWSLVVPEAMACSLPIACSIYNGCHPELVHKDENGITFDPLKIDSIVNALDYFHSVDLKQFGRRSKEIEKAFNPENTAKNVLMAVRELSK